MYPITCRWWTASWARFYAMSGSQLRYLTLMRVEEKRQPYAYQPEPD
ncbi:hypothetical protein ATR1_042d0010 [Acetobacter tropicalis]|nr:hypothetical protein ATR1_042d0010 [Acetobacter tropicalis]